MLGRSRSRPTPTAEAKAALVIRANNVLERARNAQKNLKEYYLYTDKNNTVKKNKARERLIQANKAIEKAKAAVEAAKAAVEAAEAAVEAAVEAAEAAVEAAEAAVEEAEAAEAIAKAEAAKAATNAVIKAMNNITDKEITGEKILDASLHLGLAVEQGQRYGVDKHMLNKARIEVNKLQKKYREEAMKEYNKRIENKKAATAAAEAAQAAEEAEEAEEKALKEARAKEAIAAAKAKANAPARGRGFFSLRPFGGESMQQEEASVGGGGLFWDVEKGENFQINT